MERRNFFKRLFWGDKTEREETTPPDNPLSMPAGQVGMRRALGGLDSYIGEIQMVPYFFAPQNWAFCDGQTLPISQNTDLFSMIGTTYGGNGQTNFALPNLRGTFPMHTDLNARSLGEQSGTETVTLTAANIPPLSISGIPNVVIRGTGTQGVGLTMGKELGAATLTGTNAPTAVANMPPYLAVNFIICMFGIFPPRD